MRLARPFGLLALAALLARPAEASVPRGGVALPPSCLEVAPLAEAALAPSVLDEVARLDTPRLPLFDGDELARALDLSAENLAEDLGVVDVALASRGRDTGFHPLQGLDLLADEPLRSPLESYPENRIRAFELSAPFRVGVEPKLSLWSHQACGFSCPGLASVGREDPTGLTGFFFDGTWNDMDDAAATPTNVARLYSRYGGRRVYIRGVSGLFGGGFGSGTNENVDAAYWEFVRIYNANQGNSPEEVEARTLDVVGFSRGSTAARAFVNLVRERGIPDLSTANPVSDPHGRGVIKNPAPGTTTYRRMLASGSEVRVRFLGVFDSVDSRGWPGSVDTSDQAVPPNVDVARHAIAADETRSTFPLTRLQAEGCPATSRIVERVFPGSHADVGGGNEGGDNLLTMQSLNWMWGEMKSAGVPMQRLPASQLVPEHLRGISNDDVLVSSMTHNSFLEGVLKDALQIPRFIVTGRLKPRRVVAPAGCP